MLRFEGIKEFDSKGKFRQCSIIFSDDELPKNAGKSVEKALNRYFSDYKDGSIEINVKYEDNIAEIIELVKCHRDNLAGKTDEQILKGLKKYRGMFEDYYNDIKPY
jgi:hypothetical protein